MRRERKMPAVEPENIEVIVTHHQSLLVLKTSEPQPSKEGAKVQAMGDRIVVSGFQWPAYTYKRGCTYDLVEETTNYVQVCQSVGSRDASCAPGT